MNSYISNKFKWLSFISIVMVVYIHAYNLTDKSLGTGTCISDTKDFTSFFEFFISNGLARVGVPIFLMISGYLFFFNLSPSFSGFMKKYKSRFKTVFIPFVFWGILAAILIQAFIHVDIVSQYIPIYMWYNMDLESLLTRVFINPEAFQLWFLRDLIVLIILSPIIYFGVKYLSFIFTLPFFYMWLCHKSIPTIQLGDLSFSWLTVDSVLFFSIGALLAVKKVKINKRSNKVLGIILIVSWFLLLIVKTNIAYGTNVVLNHFLHQFSILIGCAAMWHLYDIIYKGEVSSKILLLLAPSTFMIYVVHEPLMNIVMQWILSYPAPFPSKTYLFVSYILIPVAMLIFLICLNKLLFKYLPRFHRIIIGSRGAM